MRASIQEPLRPVHERRREHAGGDHADGAADPVARPDVERVVPLPPGPELRRRIASRTRQDSDDHSGPWSDVARGGGHRRKARDRPREGARGARLPVEGPVHPHPRQERERPAEHRVHERVRRHAVRRERAPRVEPEPAHPEQARTDEAEDEAVRRHWLLRIAGALAEIERAHQGRDARRNVNDGSPGEVKGREPAAERRVQQAALAPDHVRERGVDAQRPQRHEHEGAAEFHPLRCRAGNQRRRDDCEHQLIHHEREVRIILAHLRHKAFGGMACAIMFLRAIVLHQRFGHQRHHFALLWMENRCAQHLGRRGDGPMAVDLVETRRTVNRLGGKIPRAIKRQQIAVIEEHHGFERFPAL